MPCSFNLQTACTAVPEFEALRTNLEREIPTAAVADASLPDDEEVHATGRAARYKCNVFWQDRSYCHPQLSVNGLTNSLTSANIVATQRHRHGCHTSERHAPGCSACVGSLCCSNLRFLCLQQRHSGRDLLRVASFCPYVQVSLR